MSSQPLVRRLLLNVLAVGVSLSVTLLLAEAAVRLLAPQQLIVPRPDIYIPADSLGWKHRPLVNTTVNTGERTVTFRTDSSGFRIGKSGRRDTPRRVLLIGDSFMAAMQVEYEQSLAGLLDASLSTLDVSASVDNSGVAAWDPPQYLIQLRRSLNARRYDIVVVCSFLGNDIVPHFRRYIPPLQPEEVHNFRWPRSIRSREIIDAWLYPLNDVLKRHSHLFVLVKARLRSVRMRAGLTAEFLPTEVLRRDSSAGRWDTTAAIFREMSAAADSHHIPMRLFLIPSSYQVDSSELRTYLAGFKISPSDVDVNQPNRLLGSRLQAVGLRFVDVTDSLRAAKARGGRMYGAVDAHFSPDGHKILAAAVLPQVLDVLSGRDCDGTQGAHRCARRPLSRNRAPSHF